MTFEELEGFGIIYHHKFVLLQFMNKVIQDLIKRAEEHDASKFTEEEFPAFISLHAESKDVKFGTPEYEALKEKYKKDFDGHYKRNSHHPEHYENGIEGMTLVDLIEMLCDWKSASIRANGSGDINKSIELAAEKYNISPQLIKILENTADACKM